MTPVQQVETHFSTYLKACREEPVIVTQNEKPVALLLYMTDEEELERLVLSYSPKFRAILNSAKQRIKDGYGVGHEEFWQNMTNKV
jgi:PHD/YefM family antitoxin component YafN of YafNO toxin-antitoxin module